MESWYWEVWNEPDIGYWHGTPEEYNKLYDYAAAGVKRALPTARVGGPLQPVRLTRRRRRSCASSWNTAQNARKAPLDFITYHAKGRPTVVDGHVRMGIAKNARRCGTRASRSSSFPKFRNLPIVLSESDPEGCAACSARVYPQNAYRNGTLYPSYTAAMMKNIFELADRQQGQYRRHADLGVRVRRPAYFDGFRTLATNGIDKPVLNVFRMAGLMRGDRGEGGVRGAVATDAILKAGVRENAGCRRAGHARRSRDRRHGVELSRRRLARRPHAPSS